MLPFPAPCRVEVGTIVFVALDVGGGKLVGMIEFGPIDTCPGFCTVWILALVGFIPREGG